MADFCMYELIYCPKDKGQVLDTPTRNQSHWSSTYDLLDLDCCSAALLHSPTSCKSTFYSYKKFSAQLKPNRLHHEDRHKETGP
ncbi:hypothetical protein HAX54_010560, partial [Datura stramonium]|nr:hypothetical protein [Datura stramonium]